MHEKHRTPTVRLLRLATHSDFSAAPDEAQPLLVLKRRSPTLHGATGSRVANVTGLWPKIAHDEIMTVSEFHGGTAAATYAA